MNLNSLPELSCLVLLSISMAITQKLIKFLMKNIILLAIYLEDNIYEFATTKFR